MVSRRPDEWLRADQGESTAAIVTHFDFAQALERFAGNSRVWARSARMFIEQYRHCPTKWTEQVERANDEMVRSALHRTFHSLKGNAASVGAVHLAACASQLEARLRDRAEPAELKLEVTAVGTALQAAVKALRCETERYPVPSVGLVGEQSPPVESAATVVGLLEELMADLARGYARATEVHACIAPLLAQRAPVEAASLQEAIDGFDFCWAQTLCKTIRKRLCA